MPTPIAAYASTVSIAKETTPGTAATTTVGIPVTSFSPHFTNTFAADESMRGSQAKTYGQLPVAQMVEVDFGGPAYPDTVAFPIAGLLNDLAVVGASAPYTTTASLLNSGALPTSYTVVDFNGFNARAAAGCRFTEFGLKFAGNALLEYTAKAIGRTFATTSAPTVAYTAAPMQAGWAGTISIAGSSSSLIASGDLTIKRSGEAIQNVDGIQAPLDVFVGSDLEVTGSFVAVYQDDAFFTPYLNGTTQILVLNWAGGAGAAATQIQLTMSQAQFDDVQINRAQGKYVEAAIKFTAQANATDKKTAGYSPIKAVIQNALAAGTVA